MSRHELQKRSPETLPALDEVRSRAVHHFQRFQRAGDLRRRLAELREGYESEVDPQAG